MYLTRILEEGSAQTGTGWLVWVALVIFFLMVFLGWWASNKGLLNKEEEPQHVEHGHAQSAGAAHAHSTNKLTSLVGISPKVVRVLSGVGITTFAGLADVDYGKLKSALGAAGYKYMDPSGWIDQARLVVKGDTAGLKKLQASLKGGRKVT